MKQKFREVRLSKQNKIRLDQINSIIEEYRADDYVLTLRQLYYQLVSRDIIPNKQSEYSKLSRLLKEGRLGGVIHWDAIEDRLRQIRQVPTWDSPKSIVEAAMEQFQVDRHEGQSNYIEVWVEKDALSQVVGRAARKYQVPVLVNRGYGSVSAMYDTYHRFYRQIVQEDKERAFILYLGDHDPSGLDMIRDIQDRLREMLGYDDIEGALKVVHIALTTEQVRVFDPPPNPAKFSDPRSDWYVQNYGRTSWEVDALPPDELNRIITLHIEEYLDLNKYQNQIEIESGHRDKIKSLIDHFE